MNQTKPWQITPTELIKKAIEFLELDTELDRQTAFLLMDVGIETLFKIFLLLPESVTKTEVGYRKRKDATEGNFHILIETMKEAGEDQLEGLNLDRVEYFHGIRNKLYHQGDGVIPTKSNSEEYAALAVLLLDRLLNVDLQPLLNKEKKQLELIEQRKARIDQEVEPLQVKLRQFKQRLHTFLVEQLEYKEIEFAKKSFTDELEEHIAKLSRPEKRKWKSGIRRLIYDGLFILDDEDKPLEEIDPFQCDNWIYEYLDNIIESSSIGPKIKEYFDWYDVYAAEYEIIEIMTVSNLTEALLIITNRIEGLTHLIPVEDYQEILKLINWDYGKRIEEDNFDDKLSEMVERGQKLLAELPQIPDIPQQ